MEFEEEKRLCYVAMTRAKTELVMSWREEVPVFTSVGIRTVKRKRSRFLDVLVSKPRSNGTQKGSPINGPLSRMTEKAITSSARDFSSGSHRGSVRMAPPSVNKKAQQPQKLTGTGSVYAKKIHSGIAPVGATSRANQNQDPSQLKSASTTQPRQHTILQPIAPKKKVDSTLVFPVGSQVQHSQLGEGVVLAQSTFGKVTPEDVFSVTVEFRNGYTREFPVATSELSPIWGRRDVKRF